MSIKPVCFALIFALAIGTVSGVLPGQEKSADKPAEKPAEKSNEKPEEKPVLAIVGGDIHTVSGPVIRQGTLLIQDGKILEVGQSVTVPEGATVIDAAGKTITPGFVAMSMRGIGVRTTPSAKEKLADVLNPFDQNMKYALGVGITTGCVELSGGRRRFGRRRNGEPEERFPGLDEKVEDYVTEAMLDYGDQDTSLCPCCGLPILPTEPITPATPTAAQPRKLAVMKMSYGDLGSMLVKENAFYSPSPGSLNSPLQRHNWRRDLKKAREAMEQQKKDELEKAEKSQASGAKTKTAADKTKTTGKSGDTKKTASTARPSTRKPATNPDHIKLLQRELAMLVRADSVDDISDMIDLSLELGYDLVIEGGTEAWVIAEKLGVAGVSVIYTPRRRRSPQPDRELETGSFVESPRIFEDKGIPFAVATLSNSISMGGLAGRDLSSLPLEAAFAVRGGADEKTALQSLTLTPARMLGLEDRIGSIEIGKDADVLILNGSPLDYRTYVEQAVVSGEVCYDRQKDRVYPVFEREN